MRLWSFRHVWTHALAIAFLISLEAYSEPSRTSHSCIQKDFHTGIPVWVPKFRCPKTETYFFYTDIFYYGLCFFLLTLSKVYFQISKHILSIVNHSKVWKTCSLEGFYLIDDYQHFIIYRVASCVTVSRRRLVV